jgi:hypothetical protein
VAVDVGLKKTASLLLPSASTKRSLRLSTEDAWCDFCGGACGIGVYTAKSDPSKIFCEKECRDKFVLGMHNGEEPDVVY